MAINVPVATRNYYSANIERWKPYTSAAHKVRELVSSSTYHKTDTSINIEYGAQSKTGINYTVMLDRIY